jgi:hypothetical protein
MDMRRCIPAGLIASNLIDGDSHDLGLVHDRSLFGPDASGTDYRMPITSATSSSLAMERMAPQG